MEKILNIFRIYTVKKSTKSVLIILLVVATLFFLYFSFSINTYEMLLTDPSFKVSKFFKINETQFFWYGILKDIVTVFVSVLGVNLLLSLCVEKRSKNSLFKDFCAEEILYNDEFYNLFNNTQKSRILSAVENNYFSNKNASSLEMHSSMNDKLREYIDTNENYVVKKCEFSIDCLIHEDHIEKSIVKKSTICPAKGKKISSYTVLKVTSEEIANKECVELKSIKVNGRTLSEKEFSLIDEDEEDGLDGRLGYDKSKVIKLNNPLKFEDIDKGRVIEIKYITRVPITDLSYVCRMKMPCKSFSFDFEVINSDKYNVIAYPFGFIDEGKNSVNQDNKKNKIKITFDDWIFPGDGVAISLQNIKTN